VPAAQLALRVQPRVAQIDLGQRRERPQTLLDRGRAVLDGCQQPLEIVPLHAGED
jgi:hypothetical protein